MITDMDIYLFDLQGYLHLEEALTQQEVDGLNTCVDNIPSLNPGQWHGYIHGHTYGDNDGLNYQQIYEAGEPFEELINHPSWFDRVRFFIGGEGSFDEKHGPMFIDENLLNFRKSGEGIGLHNGGKLGISRCQFRYLNGKFHCNQINILIALTNIGPGDGGTVIVPGSHKSNFDNPDFSQFSMGARGNCPSQMTGSIEIHMRAGDALLFVDCCTHGSANRVNDGERRAVVYRYGPSWGNFRHGYHPSPELLERLTPERRQIVWPQTLIPRTPQV